MITRPTILGGVWAVFLVLGVLSTGSGAAERPVRTVGKQGAQYTTIQAAIDAAPDGAILRIGPGAYPGGIKIEKPLTLEGDGCDRTIILAPGQSTEAMQQAIREATRHSTQAKTADERNAIQQDLLDKRLRPAVLIRKARGVEIRSLKITCQGPPVQETIYPEAHVVLREAEAHILDCAILGAPGSGILLADGSQAEIRNSLVAGLWWTGIEIGARNDRAKCRATVADCDVRNCYYAGIMIRKGNDATIERCRISGAAWHGIRYDDCSPRILGNRIVTNHRCGIYASGKTAAVVKQNLFVQNGMSCWYENRDTIAENTFAGNGKYGLGVLGASQPVVERNLFSGHDQGIVCSPIDASSPAAKSSGDPHLKQNLFWKTAEPLVRRKAEQSPREEPEPVKLAADAESVALDPKFVNPEAEDFSLASDSPARRDRIGVADPLPMASRWPLQPEEQAIIPDGPTRDERQWKLRVESQRKPAERRDPAQGGIMKADPGATSPAVSLENAFTDLYEVLGREYPCFRLKGIDWKAVGQELLPRAKHVKDGAEFGLLCMELVARLEDSHATVNKGSAIPPVPPLPRWDPGFACLIDDRGKPVVYYVDQRGPAEKAGVKPGMMILSVNGRPAEDVLADRMRQLSRYAGYSSERYLRYHAAQFLPRHMERNAPVCLELEDVAGGKRSLELPALLAARYLPRLPVPIPDIRDSADISWKMLDGQVGYLYVRRIGANLIEQLDRAVGELGGAQGLIIDVRGNSGGGFDARRSHRNFAPNDPEETNRPRFAGPIAVLVDARCISAGEGWTSWFVAKKRARLFGEATAGASSRKRTYLLKNGLYSVTFPVKAYNGYLDRPIERRGLEPDVSLRQNARDLAAGRDTVLEAAKRYLAGQK